MTDSGQTPQPPQRQRVTNIALALVIIVALVGTTWWLGERNGWADIGTGGANARLLPKVGEEAPEFFTLREDGQPMLLSQFRGQPVWMNFWGSWCFPCRAEMPEFKTAYDRLTAEGMVILPISIGEAPEQAINYRDLVGGNFPVYIDPTYIESFVDAEANPDIAARFQGMRSDWQIRNYPTHVFIDADGIVREIVLAQMTEDEMIEASHDVMNAQSLMPQIIVWRAD
jgi:peroxiredoxin